MSSTPEDRLTRRARILDSAIAVIASQGAGVSFGAIAGAAGVSPSLITYHFRTRKDLLTAVAEALDTEMNEVLRPVATAPTAANGLRLLVRLFLQQARERPDVVIAARALVHAVPAEQRRDSPAIAPDRGIEPVSDLIADAQAAGEVPPGPAQPLAIALLGALEALAFRIASGQAAEQTGTVGGQYALRLLGLQDEQTPRHQPRARGPRAGQPIHQVSPR